MNSARTRTRWGLGKNTLTLTLGLLLMVGLAGCGKRRPVNLGEADIYALGMGIGRELKGELNRGDHLILFGVPNPIGYTEELERAVTRGLESQLGAQGVRVERIRYTEDEAMTYLRGQYGGLHADYAAAAFERHGGQGARAVVSLQGWPEPQDPFLPKQLIFVGVSWSQPVNPQVWQQSFDRVIAIIGWGGAAEGRPSRRALTDKQDALRWFDARFEVIRGVDP